MNKIATLAAGLLLLSTGIASAQSYGQAFNSFYNVVNTGVCANLTSDLTVGSKGSQVRNLQTFLVAQNYPGGGNWMITGNFGQATAAAVRNFQQQSGLALTGWVDAPTRAAINQASCGGGYGSGYTYQYPDYSFNNNSYYSSANVIPSNAYYNQYALPYNYNNTTPYNYNYAYNYSGNYQNNYNNCGTYPYLYSCYANTRSVPVLTSLSTTYVTPGNSVTIYGTGFDSVSNTVYVGGTSLRNIPSNGTMLTFTVPANVVGPVSVSVGNTFGTSNALTLNAGGNPIVCNAYPYNQNGYGNYCPPATNGQITITPASGGVGTSVTVYGWNFSATNNTVHFGNGIIANLTSYDGHSVSFTVPTTISGFGYQPIGLGAYDVSVTNGAGQTSGTVPFTITSLGGSGNNSNAPTITSVSGPTSLQVNSQGVWTVQLNNNQTNSYTTTSVNWGDQNVYGASLAANQTTYAQGNQTVSFSHTYTTTGTYTVIFTVTGVNGLSNTSSVTVNVGTNTNSNVSLTMLSPTSGSLGTQVVLYGSGFTPNDNTVHFGQGGMLHAASFNNGNNIYFTIPSYISSCDINPGTNCIYAQPVSAGTYPIYVSNVNGTTQTINFRVQ